MRHILGWFVAPGAKRRLEQSGGPSRFWLEWQRDAGRLLAGLMRLRCQASHPSALTSMYKTSISTVGAHVSFALVGMQLVPDSCPTGDTWLLLVPAPYSCSARIHM